MISHLGHRYGGAIDVLNLDGEHISNINGFQKPYVIDIYMIVNYLLQKLQNQEIIQLLLWNYSVFMTYITY